MWSHPLQLALSVDAFIPDFHLDNLVFFAGVLLSLSGIELAAFRAQEAKDPQRDYPRAIAFSVFLILFVYILGTLAIAFVVPQGEIGLIEGIMQAFAYFFKAIGMPWLIPIIAFIALIGPCAGVSTWIIGPVRGILPAAEAGFLPPVLQIQNKRGVPVVLLFIQALVGTFLAMMFLYLPSVDTAFWLVSAVSAQFALCMYVYHGLSFFCLSAL